MKAALLLCLCLFLVSPAFAGNCPESELSHMAGGIAAGGAITAIADKYLGWSEHRALIGFSVSAVTCLLAEGMEAARGEPRSDALLDAAFHAAGSAVGAIITDKYLLMPVVKRDHPNSAYVGFLWLHRF